MIKCSFSRFDIGLSSSKALPLAVYSPSFSLLATCSVILDLRFSVSETSFLRTLCFDSFDVCMGSFSYITTSNNSSSSSNSSVSGSSNIVLAIID